MDRQSLEMTYRNFWKEKEVTFEVEPYCIKVFRQRWYMVARNAGMAVVFFSFQYFLHSYPDISPTIAVYMDSNQKLTKLRPISDKYKNNVS